MVALGRTRMGTGARRLCYVGSYGAYGPHCWPVRFGGIRNTHYRGVNRRLCNRLGLFDDLEPFAPITFFFVNLAYTAFRNSLEGSHRR